MTNKQINQRLLAACIFFAAVVLLVCIDGCKTKVKTIAKVEEKVNIDYLHNHITLTTIDTTGHINADSAHVSKPLEDLKNGKPVMAETNGTKVVLQYDPETGNVSATAITKARDVPFKGMKYTFDATKFHLNSQKKTMNKGVETHTDVWATAKGWLIFAAIIAALYGLYRLYIKYRPI